MAVPVFPETPGVAEGGAAAEELPEAEVAYLTVWEGYVRWGEEMPPDVFKNSIQFLHDLVIPIPYYTKPERTKVIGAGLILVGLSGMLPAVEFDDQFPLDAGEVDNVGPDGVLSAESVVVQLSTAQVLP